MYQAKTLRFHAFYQSKYSFREKQKFGAADRLELELSSSPVSTLAVVSVRRKLLNI